MIFIDNRGKNEQEIADILSKKNYPVTVQHIDSGDYVIGDLAIERKTIDDLIGSVMSREKGHNFWNQIKVMKDTYKKQIVIIEGFIAWEDRQLAGIIYGLVDGWQIPFLNTLSKEQTALRIGQLHDRYGSSSTSRLPPCAVQKAYTPEQVRWMMVQCIPHIGMVVGKRIVEKIPYIFRADIMRKGDIQEALNSIEGLRKDSRELLERVLFG